MLAELLPAGRGARRFNGLRLERVRAHSRISQEIAPLQRAPQLAAAPSQTPPLDT